jgi:hypothetical protein
MPHVDEGQLHALLDGAFAEREARTLHEHVAACADCAARLEEARVLRARSAAILAAAQPVRLTTPPFEAVVEKSQLAKPGRRFAWAVSMGTLARAATVVAALGAGWFARDLRDHASPSDLDRAELESRTNAPAPAPQPIQPLAGEPERSAVAPPAATFRDDKKTNSAPAEAKQKVADASSMDARRQLGLDTGKVADREESAARRTDLATNARAQTLGFQLQQQRVVQSTEQNVAGAMAAAPPAQRPAGVIRATPQWQFVSLERAEQMVGRRVLRVPELDVINVGVAVIDGTATVLARQWLPGDAILELMQRPNANRVTEPPARAAEGLRSFANANEQPPRVEADGMGGSVLTLERTDVVLTGRALIPPDSLRALMLRVR